MDNFIVSARKYRPATFEDVVGQSHITETLMHEINENKLAQAFLFTGPRGVGKTTCARILARVINQKVTGADDRQDFAFNIFELDAASSNSVDDIRNLIDQVRIPPQVGKYKVYIIDEVHMLTTQAFNAFLKTLEEPPEYAIFILATTEKHKILPTILSRCQIFNFNRIEIKDISNHLKVIAEKEGIEADEDSLHLIARKADGGLRDALSIFDQLVSFGAGKLTYAKCVEILNVLDVEVFFSLTASLKSADVSNVLLTYDNILRRGFDSLTFINGLASHFRDLLVCKDIKTQGLLDVSGIFEQKYKDQSSSFSYSYLLNAIQIVSDCEEKYKTSRNQRLLVELTLLKLAHLNSYINTSLQLEELKKKLESAPISTENKNKPSAQFGAPAKPIDIEKLEKTKSILDKNAFFGIKKESENAPTTEQKLTVEINQNNENNHSQTTELNESKIDEEPEIHPEIIEEKNLDIEFNRIVESLGTQIKAAITQSEVTINNSNIHIVSSGIAYEKLEAMRADILAKLNAIFGVAVIQFILEKSDLPEQELKPYTDKEKLEAMIKKHPELLDVMNRLDLG